MNSSHADVSFMMTNQIPNKNFAHSNEWTSLNSISFSCLLIQRCGPCKLIEPLLEQCAEDWKDSLVVGKFDVEDATGKNGKSRDLKIELILQGAMPQALPALILVHNNKVLETWKGVISPTELQEMLEKHIVENNRVVGSSHDFERNASKEGHIFCENGVCKREFKTIDNLDNKKSRKFGGIGLINNFGLINKFF